MKDWKLAEAQRCLGEVVRRAKLCGPQRITGSDGEAFVLSAADYRRLLADADLLEPDLRNCAEEREGEPVSFLDLMQRSPLAEAIRAGDIDLERYPNWPRGGDDATRPWVLPSDVLRGPQRVTGPHGDVVVLSAAEFDRLVAEKEFSEEDDGDGEPAMSFVEAMRTSPLAEAMAAGEISPEEWDRACRIGR